MGNQDNQEQVIRRLQARRLELQTNLEHAQRAIEDFDRRALELLKDETAIMSGPQQPEDHQDLSYSGLTPQSAVLKFLEEHPGTPFKPSVIAKKLLRLGCPATNRNTFVIQIRTACIRLAEKGQLSRIEIEGRMAFRKGVPEGSKE